MDFLERDRLSIAVLAIPVLGVGGPLLAAADRARGACCCRSSVFSVPREAVEDTFLKDEAWEVGCLLDPGVENKSGEGRSGRLPPRAPVPRDNRKSDGRS